MAWGQCSERKLRHNFSNGFEALFKIISLESTSISPSLHCVRKKRRIKIFLLLIQRASEEAESRVKELITAVEELRGLLKQATDATNELETKMREQETNHAASEKEMSKF